MYSRNCSKGRRFRCYRKTNNKSRSFRVQVVVTNNFTAVFPNNSIANTEAQSSALTNIFCGEKWIENTLGIDDAQAAIAKGNLDKSAGSGTHDLNPGRPRAFADGVVSVVQNVEKHLLELMRVSHHFGQRFVKAFDHLDAVTDEIVRPQMHSALQDVIELHGLALRRHLAGEA